MEGPPNDETSVGPTMTPIERQMQVIAISIQDLARETSRQNQELWQAIKKGPPAPHDDNRPPPRGENESNNQEIDSHQVTRRRGGEVERTPPRSKHREESAGSSVPPSQHKTAKTTRSSKQPEKPNRSSKQPERPDKSSKQPFRQDRRDNSSRQPDRSARSSRDPNDKIARLEKELREMRKQMGGMKNSLKAKAARNLDNLVHRADSPFIPSITDFPLPSRFKVPLLENFDGTKDPFDYLEAFKTIMQLQAVPEEVMCRAFPLGLRGSAMVWFNKLESESIGSFVQLSRAFIDHFIGSQRRGRPPTHLLSVKQMEGESLRVFVHRFNKEAMKIDRPKEDVTVTAFMAGLRKGDFLYDLCKDPPETMLELMYEATKHMNAEDALETMDDPPLKRRKDTEDRKPEPAKPERKRTTAPPVKFSNFTPLNTPIDKLLLQIQDDPSLRWPEDCVALKEQVETLIRQGKLQKYVNRPANTRPTKPPAQREQAEPNRPGPVGEIRTIIGGPASGGTSRASRKAYARQDARGTHQPHDDALVITINIAGFTTRRVMVDNGSSADILYLPVYQQMRLDKDKLRPMDTPLVGFTGDKVCPNGIVTLPITVGTHPKTVSKTVDFLVVNCPSAYNAIIGRPTLNRLRAVTSTYHLLLKFPTEHGIGEVRGDQVAARECYLTSLRPEGQNKTMTIEEQKILVKPSEELDTIELEDGHPERTTKIGANLPPKMKESLVQFLKNNKDVFAWSHEDMPGINPSIISHKLYVDPSLRPVKQKRRVFAPERNNAIMEEVDKLLAANFIREVFYPDWLANVVMVKKNTGKWRMCVDFTDLNRACPKDSFPLPRIDQLVDSTAGHKLLTFMDAFSRYNQIVMDESDQDKMSFITSRGLFCYKVMPFGLKNAGATYQRLMNRMFHDQIGQNVEVYVDDMLVKSKEEDGHLDDLRETFETLRKYQMKLNPSKCAFGVYSGKFLGFMVSQRGIEANPDKIKAILEMQPPKTSKEVQRLTGRVAALNRFMSRSTDKCLPFFKTLKKAFEWTDECQQAFEELKKYLTEPPLLSPSKQGEELYLYLAVSPTAVSSALIREEERLQLPVYYTSRALRGAEERYPPMEKLAFALVTAARKLRPYFQAHTIVLLTNHPLRKAMNKLDAAGRLILVKVTPSNKLCDYKYPTTNNEAEYEALLAGLKTAKILGATELDVRSDSQLVVGQVNGDYEAKEGRMQQYLQLVRHQMGQFQEVKLSRIPREQNTETDQLAKHASSSTSDDKIKIVQQSSPQATEMNPVHTETSWMTPIISYLQRGTLPDNRHEARRLKVSAVTTQEHVLCKRRSSERATISRPCKPTPTDSFNTAISANGSPIFYTHPRKCWFKQFSQELGIHNHYSSPGHPQANGTTARIPTGETPFQMTYGSEAVVPVEIGLTTFRTSTYDDNQNEEQLRLNLDLIDEVPRNSGSKNEKIPRENGTTLQLKGQA
uniref:RNase H type-1 domain-containing protein n=1 Tax=Fagus sylvatica TaxID=28930 RepID=A0A2N9IZQ4_FAGSY